MTIQEGDTGEEVAKWQRIIGITPDGNFGPMTRNQTIEWQSDHGIDPDGIVGPLTMAQAGMMSASEKDVPPDWPTVKQIPAGTKPMKNPVSDSITKWASMVVFSPKEYPMGSVNVYPGDSTVLGRVEVHSWSHRNGKLVTGIFRGITLYKVV